MAFKSRSENSVSLESPEALFADIKARKIEGILAHQAELLRDYVSDFVDEPDVAVQLPTGSGKTLISLLIGEWRRRKFGERVLFLCPTNQLVHQVVAQANNDYGLTVTGFTGPKKDFKVADKIGYTGSNTIAVTSYSSLFNSKPFFEDPNCIILDDAHAAEQFVSSNWSIDLLAYEDEDKRLFRAIASAIRPLLTDLDYDRFAKTPQSSADLSWVDKIPGPELAPLLGEVESVISANVEGTRHLFPWQNLNGHLHSCNFFLGSQSLLIRPYLAPTFSHRPFCEAGQRIYLSATPGEGGELERIFARRKISRIEPPTGWDRHAVGRRFFVFPELSNTKDEFIYRIAKGRRALILATDLATAADLKKKISKKTRTKFFGPKDIERSKEPFIRTPNAVSVLANRYDGIDFPHDECRVTILYDLPTTTNIQERFLIAKLGASRLFDVRILTRILQSFGRCTRGATDYSLISVFGDRLISFLSKKDRRKYFHPEIQAEIEFGLEESSGEKLSNILENCQFFLDQTEEWKDAESGIFELRDSLSQEVLAGSDDLAASARDEVLYAEALWHSDFAGALDACRSVLGYLEDPDLRSCRAMWNYFAGCAAQMLSDRGTAQLDSQAQTYFHAGADAAPSFSWLHHYAKMRNISREAYTEDLGAAILVDGLEGSLESLGTTTNRKFTERETQIRTFLESENRFETGHRILGEFLGYKAGKIESQGSPDPWWLIDNHYLLVFEDYAGASEDSSVSIQKARQATTHPNWIKENVDFSESTEIVKVLITPTQRIDNGALCHLRDVCVWPLSDFRNWAESAMSTVRELRRGFHEAGDSIWRERAIAALKESLVTPKELVAYVKGFEAGG